MEFCRPRSDLSWRMASRKGKDLDIPHRPPDFDDGHVGVIGNGQDIAFDLIGDMGDDLHGPPQVISPPLLGDHRIVDLAGGKVIPPAQAGRGKPFVMPQV